MPFEPQDKVRSLTDPSRVGMVEAIGPRHAGQQYYNVFWGGALGTRTVGESDLAPYSEIRSPIQSLLGNTFSGYAEFQRTITLQRLVRDQPLRNNIYAFNASRTQFFPYQFKPLLKFLESPRHRLLICDEVGLGKTIEAGLILLELKARQSLRLVLIVCPSNLRPKWRLELRQRFGEDFRILQPADLRAFLDDYEENPERATLNGIVSLETIRVESIRRRLEELSVPFDLVIFDEAHHLRNFGTSQREAALVATEPAQAVVMLTATPVHLGEENLFSLLNLLDDEDFPDLESALERFRHNEFVVRAQAALGRTVPDFAGASALLAEAQDSPWLARGEVVAALRQTLDWAAVRSAEGPVDRRTILDIKRNLTELSLLGHILTRTRKRDVHEHVAQRRARAIELTFTPREREFYETITALVRAQSEQAGDAGGMLQWRLNTPQRRLASSVQGMIEFYRDDFDEHDDDEEIDLDSAKRPSLGGGAAEADLKARVREIVRTWPSDAPDAKYDALVALLSELRGADRVEKILVFATFRHTIAYLARRLHADGIGVVAISGEIPIDDRPALIDRFRSDGSIQVMLSSRVGSEGLDFQFCSTVVNYDLPWNPMEVEQRIGRLDRIGQQAATILIVNFWTRDTIEERILRRLYDRIGIFERSVGELEVILGDVATQLQRQLILATLSPEEAERAIEQAARVIEERRRSVEDLEASAARFVGVDEFFDEEIEAIRSRRRFVTGEQLFRFAVDFVRAEAPKTRIEYDASTQLGRLFPDEALRSFLRKSGRAGEAIGIAGAVGSSVAITFDAQTAFRHPGVEFLNVVHPLIVAIAEHHEESGFAPAAQHVALGTTVLPPGFYFFFVYRLRISAARSFNSLEAVILRDDLSQACDPSDSETLLGEMVERGEDPRLPAEVSPDIASDAVRTAESILLTRLEALRSMEDLSNNAFVDQRLASLESYYDKTIRKKQQLLTRGIEAKRQERYLRMLRSQVMRLEGELQKKQGELERLRTVGTEYDVITAGILEVVSGHSEIEVANNG